MPASRSSSLIGAVFVLVFALSVPLDAQVQTGTIAGRLLNSDSTPAVGVLMNVQQDGGGLVGFYPGMRTDSTGRFRLSVSAGRYRLAAGPMEYGPTYFPGTINAGEATILTVVPNTVQDNIDFRLNKPSAFRVAGRIRRPAGTRPNTPMVAKVALADSMAYAPSHGQVPMLFQAPVAPDGSFEFRGVPQGRYKLYADPVMASWTPITLTVSEGDVTGLDLVVPVEARVTVRVTLEENIPFPPFVVSFTGPYGGREALAGYIEEFRPGLPSRTVTAGLPAGDHRLVVTGLSSPYFVKSIVHGAKDLLRDPLLIDSVDPVEIIVTLAIPPGTGVKVAGRVIVPSGFSFSSPQSISMHVPGALMSMQTPLKADGTFEFEKVQRGTYTATLVPQEYLLYQPRTVVVGSSDVGGVEILVPRQFEVTGRLVVEGGGPRPKPHLGVSRPSLNTSASVMEDGTFKVTLPEGEHRFQVGDLPPGYFVQSIASGAVDLMTQQLRVGSVPAADVVVTIATRVPAPWRKVSGRVTGVPASSTAAVQILGNHVNQVVRTGPDGSFEFSDVLPGTYTVFTGTLSALPKTTIVVSDRDVSGIQLAHHRFATFRGRTVVEGGGPAVQFQMQYFGPSFRPPVLTQSQIQTNGEFTATLPEEEISLLLTNVPPGYSVKSITYGGGDILQGTTKFSSADRQEIIVTFAVASPPPWRRVNGRVVTPANSQVRPHSVTILAGSGLPHTAPVSPDGNFEFSKVLPGNYRVQAHPIVLINEVTFRVVDKDLSGIEVPFPSAFEVPGRTVMADGSALPGDFDWFVNSVRATGNFKVLLQAGQHKVTFGDILRRYRIVSATYGAVDLLNEPLSLNAPATGEIVVTVARAARSTSLTGVALRGRLTGAASALPSPPRVFLYELEADRGDEVPIAADGSFMFLNVPPGYYSVQPVGSNYAATALARIRVTDRDIGDLVVSVFRSIDAPARVVMDDNSALPTRPPLRIYAIRSSDPVGREIPPDGRFTWTVAEDEQFIVVQNLPEGYFVKSMTYGTVDLLKHPLKLDPAVPPAELRITIGRQ